MVVFIFDIIKALKVILPVLAVTGNMIFIVWILYNGVNEKFEGTLLEKISYISLLGLLAVNTILLLSGRTKKTTI